MHGWLIALGLPFAGVERGCRRFFFLLGLGFAIDLAGDLLQLISEQLAVFLEANLLLLLGVLSLRLYATTVILHSAPFIIHPPILTTSFLRPPAPLTLHHRKACDHLWLLTKCRAKMLPTI
jgi:hypothetical protein